MIAVQVALPTGQIILVAVTLSALRSASRPQVALFGDRSVWCVTLRPRLS